MSTTKCSYIHIQDYRRAINQYLTTKGTSDFSKYVIHFKADKLVYDRWNYPETIPKPVDIQPLPSEQKNYKVLETRSIIIDITTAQPLLIINSLGNRGVSSSNPPGEKVEAILRTDYYNISDGLWKWKDFTTMTIKGGLIEYRDITVEKIKLIFTVSKDENTSSSSQVRPAVMYTLPSAYGTALPTK
jgi:hypothetical protein